MEKGQGRRSVFGIGVPNKPELSGAAVRFSYDFGICHLAFAGKMFAKGSVTEFGGEILDDQSRHVVVVSCVQRCVVVGRGGGDVEGTSLASESNRGSKSDLRTSTRNRVIRRR